jgi:hypothetical protein
MRGVGVALSIGIAVPAGGATGPRWQAESITSSRRVKRATTIETGPIFLWNNLEGIDLIITDYSEPLFDDCPKSDLCPVLRLANWPLALFE